MNVDYLLKKANITNVKPLDSNQIKVIAKDLSIKLCLAFPEHDLMRENLYYSFCSLDMFTASMPKDSSGAKFISGSHSIYFNEDLDFSAIPDAAMHECIHFLQEARLNDSSAVPGLPFLALNEAAIQLMASEANMASVTEEKYFNITIRTVSPTYYPLECVLLNEIVYFTGSYALYHSVLNSNDVFKNTFITKFSKKIYNKIFKQLDKLLNMENELVSFTNALESSDNASSIKELTSDIEEQKQNIKKLFFNIQDYIIKNCFSCEFNNVKTLEDLKDLKFKLYNFKNIVAITNNYSFYNEFYCDFMNALENKKEQLLKYGEISLYKQECTSLAVIDNSSVFRSFFKKLKKLFGFEKQANDNYNNY